MTRDELYEAIVMTAAVLGHELSPGAVKLMAGDLMPYPESKVRDALLRCRRELTGRLSLAAILQRIDTGHLGAEDAWALCPASEEETVVWTEQIAEAWSTASRLLPDKVAARMAFKEAYARLMRDASGEAVWTVCLGHDRGLRCAPIQRAVESGWLTPLEAMRHIDPELPGYAAVAALAGLKPTKALPAPKPVAPARPNVMASDIEALLCRLKGGEGSDDDR